MICLQLSKTTISEADHDKVYNFIAKRLADTLTGDQSYYPEGPQKDVTTRAKELDNFIDTLRSMRQSVNDPANILGSVIDELEQHALDFHARVDRGSAPIELPPEFSPTTRDNRVIQVDPFPRPYSPPNPLIRRNWPKDSYTSFDPNDVNSAPTGVRPGAGSPQQAIGLPGLYSGRPTRQYVVPPPLFGRR